MLMAKRKISYLILLVGIALTTWLSIRYFLPRSSDSETYRASSKVFSEAMLIANREIDGVYFYLVFPAGEASNPFEEGLAHYVEHLAWLSAFDTAGGEEYLHSNAWTNHFSTGYWQTTVPDGLHEALRTLISVSAPLSVDTDFALQELDIILREYDFRVLGRPLYPVLRDMNKRLYGNGALARSVIGDRTVISHYSLDVARDLHKQSHVLSRATLLVYGNVSKRQFEALLNSLPVETAAEPVTNPASTVLADNGSIVDRASVLLPGLAEDTFLYRKLNTLPICGTPVRCEMIARIAERVLASALPGGLAGPLRFDQFVARSFSFDITLLGNHYVELSFTAHPDNGVSLEVLQQLFENELQASLENGIPRETFDRVLARAKSKLDSVPERDRPRYNRDLALRQLMSGKPIMTWSEQRKALQHIRREGVNQFLKALLTDGRVVARSAGKGV